MAEMNDSAPSVRAVVQNVLGRLQSVHSVVLTVCTALKVDEIEQNPDYAVCLERCAMPDLNEAIAQLDELQGRT